MITVVVVVVGGGGGGSGAMFGLAVASVVVVSAAAACKASAVALADFECDVFSLCLSFRAAHRCSYWDSRFKVFGFSDR